MGGCWCSVLAAILVAFSGQFGSKVCVHFGDCGVEMLLHKEDRIYCILVEHIGLLAARFLSVYLVICVCDATAQMRSCAWGCCCPKEDSPWRSNKGK